MRDNVPPRTQHTAAPWLITRVSGNPSIIHFPPNKSPVAIASVFERTQPEATDANARLIAAAPELLEACRVTLANLELIGTHPNTLPMKALKSAIAKAEAGK